MQSLSDGLQLLEISSFISTEKRILWALGDVKGGVEYFAERYFEEKVRDKGTEVEDS